MDKFLPLVYDEWNDHLKRKAEKELNENEASIPNELEELKKLIEEERLLCYADDSFLIWFLRGNKHDVRRSFDQLKRYSEDRHIMMVFYGFTFFKNTRVPIERGIVGILPKRDDEGRAILYIRPSAWSPDICHSDNIIRTVKALAHFALEFPATQVNGFCIICDSQFGSLNTLLLFIKYTFYVGHAINVFPTRFQKICIVNVNAVLRWIAPLFLGVITPVLRKETTFYGDAKTALPEIFHPSILPEEFGGTMGPLSTLHESWLEAYGAYVSKIQAENKYYKREDTIPYPETEEMWDELSTPKYFS